MSNYYDGTKLLSLKDINGNKPEIYMCTTNRTGGKTTYFGRLVVNRFLSGGGKFGLLYRYNYELDDVSEKFFKDIGTLFFKEKTMEHKRRANGVFFELFLDEISCGYAMSLNNADNVKKYSHLFSDINRMIFDEFQNESNKYCTDEVSKFISIHTSIARGQGEQTRYVPVYMLANPVSIINPYYVELGISSRLKDDTKFLKGDGFVLEQGFVKSASKSLLESGFNRAFSNSKYVAYSAQNVYLNDNKAFVEKLSGRSRYVCTIKHKDTCYAVREFPSEGLMYVDYGVNHENENKFAMSTSDHQTEYVFARHNDFMLQTLRTVFEKGLFRFKDLRCKEAILSALSY